MIKVVSSAEMREIEAAADASGISYADMMENAGRAAAIRALKIIQQLPNARVTVLIGPGNNGGDGLVAGRIIAQESKALVRFYLLKHRAEDDAHFRAVAEAGLLAAYAEDDQQYRVLRNMVASADLVIDALFGIGIKLPIKDEAAKVLRNVNQALNERRSEKPEYINIDPTDPPAHAAKAPYVLAVDCPSGLDCDSGQLDKQAIKADETITFIAAKTGLLVFPGAGHVGTLNVAPCGIPDDLPPLKAITTVLVDGAFARALLPERPLNSHKGMFGKALLVAGSVNYTGAAALAACAAYRSGAGLVTVGAPQPVVMALATQLQEPTWLLLPQDMGVLSEKAAEMIREELGAYQALLLGPGWGREETTRTMLKTLLDKPAEAPAKRGKRSIGFLAAKAEQGEEESALSSLPPLVIDADGLNLLSEIEEWWKLLPANTILTPHPGEMARLAGLSTEEVQAQRLELARSKAAEWQAVVLLKGAHTVVAAADGRAALLPFKNDALAKAGTGDVLAGAIVGLLAQGVAAFEAAALAAYLHGLAGQLAAEWLGSRRGVLAGDVLDALPEALGMLG
ncbi:MAG: bifunctional hydroxymethylpyrimidine kinase/phosphomethylpyrimidine kinase [Chloroflexi bacterium]|nr:bifunctional hydroxymethylpyrimidine kinase/phosphomethylpyrimidine kinase [Chloroflexota bacterium]